MTKYTTIICLTIIVITEMLIMNEVKTSLLFVVYGLYKLIISGEYEFVDKHSDMINEYKKPFQE